MSIGLAHFIVCHPKRGIGETWIFGNPTKQLRLSISAVFWDSHELKLCASVASECRAFTNCPNPVHVTVAIATLRALSGIEVGRRYLKSAALDSFLQTRVKPHQNVIWLHGRGPKGSTIMDCSPPLLNERDLVNLSPALWWQEGCQVGQCLFLCQKFAFAGNSLWSQ